MKKTLMLLTFFVSSIILITCIPTSFADSNLGPFAMFMYPENPFIPPSITVNTPVQNATYNVTDPKTVLNIPLDLDVTYQNKFHGNIVSAWYTLDNGSERFPIAFQDSHHIKPHLLLGCGVYNLTVGLNANSIYVGPNDQGEWVYKSAILEAKSEPIKITINPPPTPTPTITPTPQIQNQPALNPTDCLLLIGVIAVAVVAPILIYRRHNKQQFHS